MKDFLIAEYKTIILVLLFCGGIFFSFYAREVQKDAEKAKAKAWVYQCMTPGKSVGDYVLGKPAPTFDDTWESITDAVPDMTVWRHFGGDMIINVDKNNTIRTIELYPSEERFETCQADFDAWAQNNKSTSAPIKKDDTYYTRYPGILTVSHLSDNALKTFGWIITSTK
ncbi:MAG: hypothetical protein IIY06_04465 [Proteobacteria bacterium]|jgi:hypothetical protein|nr:hypothetical protein [Pseudomonadota bacterium]